MTLRGIVTVILLPSIFPPGYIQTYIQTFKIEGNVYVADVSVEKLLVVSTESVNEISAYLTDSSGYYYLNINSTYEDSSMGAIYGKILISNPDMLTTDSITVLIDGTL